MPQSYSNYFEIKRSSPPQSYTIAPFLAVCKEEGEGIPTEVWIQTSLEEMNPNWVHFGQKNEEEIEQLLHEMRFRTASIQSTNTASWDSSQ